MENDINHLEKRLQDILQQQEELSGEINKLKKELYDLKSSSTEIQKNTIQEIFPLEEKPVVQQKIEHPVTPKSSPVPNTKQAKEKSNWEKFIGENLINKIGIR
jgi:archaellum component FlaC